MMAVIEQPAIKQFLRSGIPYEVERRLNEWGGWMRSENERLGYSSKSQVARVIEWHETGIEPEHGGVRIPFLFMPEPVEQIEKAVLRLMVIGSKTELRGVVLRLYYATFPENCDAPNHVYAKALKISVSTFETNLRSARSYIQGAVGL